METYKIKDICEITSSKRVFANQYTQFGIPFYRGKEITQLQNNESISESLYISEELFNEIMKSAKVPSQGDILMTAVGTLGSLYLVKSSDRFYFKDGNIIWFRKIDSSKILSKYLYYYFLSSHGQNKVIEGSIGSTQRALTIDIIKELSITIPNLQIQQHIVNTTSFLLLKFL